MQHDDIIDKFKGMLESQIHIAKQARMEDDRQRLMSTIGQDLAQMLAPFLAEVASSSKLNKETLAELMYQLRGEVANKEMAGIDTTPIINAIELTLGNFKVPEPKVTVTIPPIKIPDIKMPEEMNIRGWVSLMGVDLNNPLPVQLRDAKGNPIHLFENLTQILNGGGGGKHDFFTIKGFSQSAFAEIINPDGRIKVEIATGGSGLTDAELRAAHLDVQQVSGAIDSVNVSQFAGDALAKGVEVNNGFLRVMHATDVGLSVNVIAGSTSGVEYEDEATVIDPTGKVVLVQDANGSLFALRGGTGNADGRTLRVVHAADVGVSMKIINEIPAGTQNIGDIDIITGQVGVAANQGEADIRTLRVIHAGDVGLSTKIIAEIPAGTQNIGDVDLITGQIGIAANQGESDARTMRIVHAGDVGVSVNATIQGTPTVTISGSLTSTVATGPTPADVNDDGSAPIQTGGIARQANPTAVAAGDVVKSTHDDLGRQIMRIVQVRDLIATAYVSVSNGTETTLLAAVAGSYLDLIYVMGTNNSDAAVTVDIRAVTGGNVMTSIRIPANGTAGVALPVPIPQDETGNNWTADLPDITGSTITISALFSKEI